MTTVMMMMMMTVGCEIGEVELYQTQSVSLIVPAVYIHGIVLTDHPVVFGAHLLTSLVGKSSHGLPQRVEQLLVSP